MALSVSFRPIRSFSPFFTGGTVILWNAPSNHNSSHFNHDSSHLNHDSNENQIEKEIVLSVRSSFLLCQSSATIAQVDLETGTLMAVIDAEEGTKQKVTANIAGRTATTRVEPKYGWNDWAFDENTKDEILTFALSENGLDVLAACRSGLIRHFVLGSNKLVHKWKGHELPITDMKIDPTGTLLATASIDRSVRVWHIEGGYCTHALRDIHGAAVRKVWFAPQFTKESIKVLSADDDGGLVLWILYAADSKRTEQILEKAKKKKKAVQAIDSYQLKSHMNLVTDAAFHPNEEILVTVSRDNVLNVWDLKTFALIKTIPIYEAAEAVSFVTSFPGCPLILPNTSFDNMHCAIAGEKGAVVVIRLSTAKVVFRQKLNESKGQALTHMFFSQPGYCITVTSEHNFCFWDVATFERKRLLVGYNDEIISIKCFPSNIGVAQEASECTSNWALIATNSNQMRLLNLHNFDTDTLGGHSDLVLGIDISPSGNFIVSVSSDCTMRIWSIDLNAKILSKCIAVGSGHTDAIAAVAYSKKLGDHSFIVTGSKDRTLKVWFTSDIVDHVVTARHTVVAHEKDINCVAISPNDKLIASASADKTIKLWSPDLSVVGILRGHKRGVWFIEFSKVDKVLASASGDKTIRIWSVADFSCLKTLEGHTASVLSVSFITHGTQLLSSDAEGILKLWTLKTNECVATYDEHQGKIWAMSLTADGKHVVTGGSDSCINIWQDVTREEVLEQNARNAEQVILEQDLSNAMLVNDYERAIHLALGLNQPRKLMNCLEIFLGAENARFAETSNVMNTTFAQVLKSISPNERLQLIQYCRDWNTNAKHASLAHRILNIFLRICPPSEIKQMNEVFSLALHLFTQIKELIAGLIPYTEKHFQRMNMLMQKSYLSGFACFFT